MPSNSRLHWEDINGDGTLFQIHQDGLKYQVWRFANHWELTILSDDAERTVYRRWSIKSTLSKAKRVMKKFIDDKFLTELHLYRKDKVRQ